MTIRARMQIRDKISVAEETTNELAIKTARLVTQGNLFTPDFRYMIQLAFGSGDFETSSASPLFDAYVEYALFRDLQIRAGQYFVPFDRARTIREFALQLADRPQMLSELNLDRDIGITLFSQDLFGLDGRLSYALGVFGGAGKNRFGGEPFGFLYVGRISYRPFGGFDDDVEADIERLNKPRLALGIAGAYNQKTQRQRSTTGATFQLGGFNYAHAAGDLVFKYDGFSFLGEVIYRRASVDSHEGTVDDKDVVEWSRSGWGYVIQTGMMLTSMVEVAARWDELFAFDGTDPALVKSAKGNGHEAGGGVNLYLNGHLLKLQADYAAGLGNARTIHLVRLLLDATF
jgi:hypothetical protein